MNKIRKVTAFVLLVLMCSSAFAGLGSNQSLYVGGTAPLPKDAQGIIDTKDEKRMIFSAGKDKDGKDQLLAVPYDKIVGLAYGQHAGRRVGATVALGVTTLGIGALPMLFSKKRRHYLTVEYTDGDGKNQAAIFEVGKDAIRTTLKSLEVRSGKKVEFEDDEAKKAGNK